MSVGESSSAGANRLAWCDAFSQFAIADYQGSFDNPSTIT